MVKKSKTRPKPKHESPQVKRLRNRVKTLKSALADSVPAAQVAALRGTLDAKISRLQDKLASAVPRSDAEALQSRAKMLESKLAMSVPKIEMEKTRSEMLARIKALEEELSGSISREDADAEVRSSVEPLKEQLAQSVPRRQADALEGRVAELEEQLSGSTWKAQLEKANSAFRTLENEDRALRARVKELESKLNEPVPKTELEAQHVRPRARTEEAEVEAASPKAGPASSKRRSARSGQRPAESAAELTGTKIMEAQPRPDEEEKLAEAPSA